MSNGKKHRNRTKGFTMIPTSVSFDEDLSLKGFGMLIKLLILSEMDNWEFSEMGLVHQTGWGRTTVRTALQELERLGYLVRTQPRNTKGRYAKTEWHIFESPVRVDQSGEVTGVKPDFPNLPDAYQYPNFSDSLVLSRTAPELDYPMSQNQTSGAQTSGANTQYNTYNNKYNNNKYINSECCAPDAECTQHDLFNETRGGSEGLPEHYPSISNPLVPSAQTHESALSETERVIKQLKRKYKRIFVDYALELSKDKDDQLIYAKTLLRDWKKQEFKTIESVRRYVSSFEEEPQIDLTVKRYQPGKPIRRVEQTPEWLGQQTQPYDPNRKLNAQEQEAVDRMKEIQDDLLNKITNKLPF